MNINQPIKCPKPVTGPKPEPIKCPLLGGPAPEPIKCPMPLDDVKIEGPKAGFEPWLGGGVQSPPKENDIRRAIELMKRPQGPSANIEPWQRGELTSDPSVSSKFAGKMSESLGDAALLSVRDERISSISGYFLEGWEGVGGDTFVNRRALGALGDQWKATDEFGTFETKSGSVQQKLSFDMAHGITRLESSYEDNTFDTTKVSEILTLDRQGTMRREHPPIGM